MTHGEKCYCGHAKRNHSGVRGLIGGGLILYLGCHYCDCVLYSGKSSGKEEWERVNRNRSEYAHLPLPSRISDIQNSCQSPESLATKAMLPECPECGGVITPGQVDHVCIRKGPEEYRGSCQIPSSKLKVNEE